MDQTHSSLDITTDRGEPEVTRTFNAAEEVGLPASAPAMIDRYSLRSLIGQGGFGQVFLAFDPQLQRNLAIKIPRQTRAWKGTQTDAFLREARLAARLAHPHVVTIHNVGVEQDGRLYIVMEFIEGESLQRRLQRGRLTLTETSSIIRGIAAAMQYAHKQEVIHRDLKPANVLIDKSGHVKVTDFGLAISEEIQAQYQGEVSGTPAYMSPEQVRGEVHQLDGRSDLWSLGVILYECLTGRRPFQGATWPEIRDEILNRTPKPPRQIDDTISVAIEAICLACLEKDPKLRPSTALDIANVLTSSVAQPPTSIWRLSKSLPILSAFSVAMVVGVISLLAWNSGPSKQSGNRNEHLAQIHAAAGLEPIGLLQGQKQKRQDGPAWKNLEVFAFPHGLAEGTYFYDPVHHRFCIISDSYAAFRAGEHSDPSFRLEVAGTLAKDSHFGLLWNIQEIPVGPLNQRQEGDAKRSGGLAGVFTPRLNRAYSACAAYYVAQGMDNHPAIRIGRLTFAGVTDDSVGLWENGFVEEVPLKDAPDLLDSRLAIEVRDGLLQRVIFQGEDVPTTLHQKILPFNPEIPSTIGILAAYGSISVTDWIYSRKGPLPQ